MALIDKLKPQSDGTILISAHDFTDSLAFWAEGIKSRADLVSQYNLDDTVEMTKSNLICLYLIIPDSQHWKNHFTLISLREVLEDCKERR